MRKLDPQSPLGYGISIVKDFSNNVRRSSGAQKVGEMALSRLLDGPLWYSPDYGMNIIDRINKQPSTTYDALATEAERVVAVEERIQDVSVSISQPDVNGLVTVTMAVVAISGETFDTRLVIDRTTADFDFS